MKRIPKYIYCLNIIAFTCSNFAYSGTNELPEEFRALEKLEAQKVKLYFNDDYVELGSSFSYNYVIIDKDQANKLERFLERQYLSSVAKTAIKEKLISGVSSSTACYGSRYDCIVDFSKVSDVQFVVVPDNHAVRIIVPDSYMSNLKTGDSYIPKKIDKYALISNHSFHAGAGNTDSFSYRNKSVLGLYSGYLKSNFNLSSEDSQNKGRFYFDELDYNYIFDDNKINFGYYSYLSNQNYNSTDLLDTDDKKSTLSINLSSTNELKYKNKKNDKRLYFSSPSSGRLKILLDDGSVYKELNVNAGQNYISYQELPKGISNITLEVYSGDNVIYSDKKKIYNVQGYSSIKGDFNYVISGGYFLDNAQFNNLDDNQEKLKLNDNEYLSGKLSYVLTESLVIGSELLLNNSDNYFKIGAEYHPIDNISLSSVYQHFGDRSNYKQVDLSFYNLYASWQRFEANEYNSLSDDINLADYLFGLDDFYELNASLNYSIFDGNLYLSYSSQRYDNRDVLHQSDSLKNQDNESISGGYSFRSFFDSTIDINTTYTKSSLAHGTQDELSTMLNISIPFGMNGNYNFSVMNHDNNATYRTSVQKSAQINQNSRINGEVFAKYTGLGSVDDKFSAGAMLSANYNDDLLNSSVYGYIDTTNEVSIYGDLESTSVITSDGLYGTSEFSDSYLLINNKNYDFHGNENKLSTYANLKKNGTDSAQVFVDSPETIYPLERYNDYVVTIKDGASDYHNLGETNTRASSYPGTMLELDVDINEVNSYISVFTGIDGKPIDDVKCKGDGCLSVVKLADGVFKFRISNGKPFDIVSNDQKCFIPRNSDLVSKNLGKNFCMPDFSTNDDDIQIATLDDDKYFYIGEFSDESILRKLTKLSGDYKLFTRKIGERTFAFARSHQNLDTASIKRIKEMSSYALEEKSVPYVYEKFK
ncbi:TPA: CS1-pili formation C-terminal domain-containing protein [Photobacterium damselae]